jgi:signal transduction histidine kinase
MVSAYATADQQTHADVKHDAMPAVKGNQFLLLQLFQNVIGNAIKYRKEDTAPQVQISARRENEFWRFCVADNGIGIEPQHHARIFGMFKQLNPGVRGGAGVGLAISKRIVERHGGSMSVESTAGEGCRFYFTLQSADLDNLRIRPRPS